MKDSYDYDVVLVGSGTCGSSLGRYLAEGGLRVLILEKGRNLTLKESLKTVVSIAREDSVGGHLKATYAVTAGGSTALYFGVCKLPDENTFKALGVNLADEYAEISAELPINKLPDSYDQPQSKIVCESANTLGYPMKKNWMLIDTSKSKDSTYVYEDKWRAKSNLTAAIKNGAVLIDGAEVTDVLREEGRATGVEYLKRTSLFKRERFRVSAKKVVLAGGPFVTAKLLKSFGLQNIGSEGFFCKPVYAMFGELPSMEGGDAFVGGYDHELSTGVYLGDGVMNKEMYRLVMLANMKWRYLFKHKNMISVGLLLKDSIRGSINADGEFVKNLTDEEKDNLNAAEKSARKILEHAGAKNIFATKPVAGIPGGILKVGREVDENFETGIDNLHVCDHSLINDVKITPTVTLVCMARYLSKYLISSLSENRESVSTKNKSLNQSAAYDDIPIAQ